MKVWRGYEHSLRTRPLQTQMVTSTVLWYVTANTGGLTQSSIQVATGSCLFCRGLGDLFAQRIDGKHVSTIPGKAQA